MSIIEFSFGSDDLNAALDLIDRHEGRYALGSSNFWHGGVHLSLSESTKAIRSPTHGVVIAHRTMTSRTTGKASFTMDSEGKKVSTDSEEDIDSSFSFVLTQHKYVTPKKQEIVFYLLHMHLLCYDNYTDQHKLWPPPYLHHNVTYTVDSDEDDGGLLPNDGEKGGLNIRSGPTKNYGVLSVLKKGSEFTFVERGSYNHAKPESTYLKINISNPKSFNISNASIDTGVDSEEKLRIAPDADYYRDHGELYRCNITSQNFECSEEKIDPKIRFVGVRLYLMDLHVGYIKPSDSVYLTEEFSQSKRYYPIILDNIEEILVPTLSIRPPSADCSLNTLFDSIDTFEIGEPTETMALKEVLKGLGSNTNYEDLDPHIYSAHNHTIIENRPDIYALHKIVPNGETFDRFVVNTHEDNGCGVSALDGCQRHLLDIPYKTKIKTASKLSVSTIKTSASLPILPLTIKQPSTGYIYCGAGRIKHEINEVTGKFDEIEVFSEPVPIYKGDVLGYPGSQQKQGVIHVECWLDNVDFFENSKSDAQYEDAVDLPSGIPAKEQILTHAVGKAIPTTIPANTHLPNASIKKSEKTGKNGPIRKITYNGKAYYIYRDAMTPYKWKNPEYIILKSDRQLDLYETHPELPTETITVSDTTLPEKISLKPVANKFSIDKVNYFAVKTETEDSETGGIVKTLLVSEDELNKYRANLYDWKRFFMQTTAEELGLEKSGFFEAPKPIEQTVSDNYKQAVQNEAMEPAPDYQRSHPLSHLFIQSATEWSTTQKTASGWKDAVINFLWKENVSSLEEYSGLTQANAASFFDQTIKKYSDNINFYDDIPGLPDKSHVWHTHPLRFLGHLRQLKEQFRVMIKMTRIKQWPKNENASNWNARQGGTISKFTVFVDGIEKLSGYILEAAGPSSRVKGSDQRVFPGSYFLTRNPGSKGHHPFRLVQKDQQAAKRIFGNRVACNIHTGNRPENIEGCLAPGENYKTSGSGINEYPVVENSKPTLNKLVKIIEEHSRTTGDITVYDGAKLGYGPKAKNYVNKRLTTPFFLDVLLTIEESF